ncbi:tyrosine-type recombinase/integrase [Sulfitobacter sp. JB4-11]|uniref:tyrosine-type recombinase/integrase n=1 Tax=Sulfitobacter rhodophyticola TaxID=3238304 RepID=UPI0035168E7B
MTDYLEWSKLARSEGGHYNNLTLMNYHLVPDFSSIPIEAFCGKDLQRLAAKTLEQPPKRGFEATPSKIDPANLSADEVRRRKRTFNSLVTILRMVFRYAWENGHLTSERSWKCLNRVSVNHQPRTIFLTRSECKRLLAACSLPLRNLVMAALYSGCRVGELGDLRVADVGNGGFGVHIKPFKRSPARFVFLPEEGMAFFLEACAGKQKADHLFLSTKGLPWRRQHTLQFRTAVAKAGLPREFVFHGLRHTYASDLIQGGATLDAVARQLGHASTLTVMTTYGHLAAHVREAQVRRSFSALSKANQAAAGKQEERFAELRRAPLPETWDREGNFERTSSLPRTSLARPSKGVLETFASIPGRH